MTDKIHVARDPKSPTGHSIYIGDVKQTIASVTVVGLYRMYIEALDLARRLHAELDKISQLEIDCAAKVKSSRGKKDK